MRYFFYFLLCGAILSGCQQSTNNATTELEKALESSPNIQNAQALIKQYLEDGELMKNPSKKEQLYSKASKVALDHKVYGQAMGILQQLILNFPDSPETISRLTQISQIFSTLRRDDANAILLRTMAEKHPNNNDIKQLNNRFKVPTVSSDSLISALGLKMFNDSLLQLNKPAARQYVDACEAYAMVMGSDPKAAEYLHKGAETARSLQTIDKAILLYDWIIERYPDHPRAAQSLFLKAFTLDNNLKNYDEARALYEEFLKKYPENEFVASAQFLLENLGKSDEELLETLQKKGKEQG
jgi:TolA-binding protein